jgi:signal transduction histidine kinase
MIEQTISDLRRVTRDLRPIYLEDLGLVTALDMLARDTERLSNISVTLQVSGERRRLQSDIELALYRIAQEALSNIVRHAKATNVTIHLEFGDPQVRLAVKDNGNGFVVPKDPAEMAASGHFGLLGIQERAELMGARMELASASNEGTKLSILLPEA